MLSLRTFLYMNKYEQQSQILVKLVDSAHNTFLAEDYLKKIIYFHQEYLEYGVWSWEITDNHSITLWISKS